MKRHIIGFTIFAFIVGSFVSIWALFGYFTQTIPNVPNVQPEKIPVFEADKRTSCFSKQREKISYEVVDSYYFADEDAVVSTLKLKWNGYGAPPKNVFVEMKIFSQDFKDVVVVDGKFLENVFAVSNEVNIPMRSKQSPILKASLKENLYIDYSISTDTFETSKAKFSPKQVVVVHGDSSIISK